MGIYCKYSNPLEESLTKYCFFFLSHGRSQAATMVVSILSHGLISFGMIWRYPHDFGNLRWNHEKDRVKPWKKCHVAITNMWILPMLNTPDSTCKNLSSSAVESSTPLGCSSSWHPSHRRPCHFLLLFFFWWIWVGWGGAITFIP